MVKIACIQMTSGPDIAVNLAYAVEKIREAAVQGVVFISTPENTDFMMASREQKFAAAYTAQTHPAFALFSALARELNVTILIGSIAVKAGGEKLRNRSVLFAPDGRYVTYDKIHLFDVDLPSGEIRRESDMMEPGDKAVIADTAFGRVGMTICYDVRFPHLYRDLAHQGAVVIAVPAAFTVPTGQMHWEVLLRARAIENGVFVIAAAQCGDHDGGRKTYGHSMIIDPWGRILAEACETPTVLYADIDMAEVEKFRAAIPSLRHDRAYR